MKTLLSAAKLSLFTLMLPLLTLAADIQSLMDDVASENNLPQNDATTLLQDVLMWLLLIFTILAVLSFIISGIMFVLAGANKDLAEKAKTGISYSIIGIAVALSAYIIITLVYDIFSGTGTSGTSSSGFYY